MGLPIPGMTGKRYREPRIMVEDTGSLDFCPGLMRKKDGDV